MIMSSHKYNPLQESIQTQTHHDSNQPSQESHQDKPFSAAATAAEEGGRERLKRHRMEMAGRVWIPDTWGQENLLKDWIDCAAFDASLVSTTIIMARDSLAQQGRRRPNSTAFKMHN